tara:strand:+ start:1112 stop:2788 length:1677 start_codon:yes stop_codon:yes gene_type:complete
MTSNVSLKKTKISKKTVVGVLIIIAIISLSLKLYTSDFTNPVNSDSLAYSLAAISHTQGDFSQSSHRGIGWSLFVSPFYSLIDSENFIDYSNAIKTISLTISTGTTFIVYLLGRKFFNEKYSLVAASLFAFEPHLNFNSGLGLTEPLYHLVLIMAFYFLLNDKTKFFIPSLLLIGAAFWIRFGGLAFVVVFVIIYCITKRNSPNFLRNLAIGLVLFLLVISPMLYQRDLQFEDPFYYAYSQYVFTGSFEQMVSIENKNTETTMSDYIQQNGLPSFIYTFILNGIFNILSTTWTISFPYLFILLPFGIMFSFRAFDQDKKRITSNWLFIVLSLCSLILTFSIIPDKRHIFYLYPFLIIFSIIPLQRVTEYGLSTFSFSDKQKTIFLVIVISIVLILSMWFTMRYGEPDVLLENEKYDFSHYVIQNFNGNSLREFGGSLDYLRYIYVEKSPEKFFNCDVEYNKNLCGYDKNNGFLQPITITGNSVEEIISKGQTYDLKYILVNKEKNDFHGFIDEIYFEEQNHPYLNKIFDSKEFGYKKLEIKVFEIDYKKFSEYLKIEK